MFRKTRLKLTGWYLLIILCISVFFSGFIYTSINQELNGIEQGQRIRQQRFEDRFGPVSHEVSEQLFNFQEIQKARIRVIATLGLVNVILLFGSGVAGYFLAGLTLKPIKTMIDEQNQFITDSSHELKTPLTALRSEIEVNLRNKTLTLSEARKLLESNLEEVVSLQVLSERLLDLAQNGSSIPTGLTTSFELGDALNSALKKLDSEISKKHISIKKKVEPVVIPGMRERIEELFVILIDNAVKYSPEKTTITVVIKEKDKHAKIKISDQGYGIAKKDLPHVFDRFYRASESRSKGGISGYGLGLSIAKKIVIVHNGSIHVDSVIDHGTKFTVELPVEES